MDENLTTKHAPYIYIYIYISVSFIFPCFLHPASQHFSFPFLFLPPHVNWRFAGVYALARQPLPSEARLQALFVILITRVMSLAALAACARAQTCFICELIYYANYFSECTPRESPTRRLACSFRAEQTYAACKPTFRARSISTVAVLSLLSVLLPLSSTQVFLALLVFLIMRRVCIGKEYGDRVREPQKKRDNWLAWLRLHNANVCSNFCWIFLHVFVIYY